MNRPRLILTAVAVLTLVGMLLTQLLRHRAPTPPSTKTASGANTVVLISIDTCRADHLGCYGASADITPRIDAFSREAIRFERAVSPVPMTLPAHASMFTGTIPPWHHVHANVHNRLAEAHTTLAEQLHDNGYQTAGFISAMVLEPQFGLAQGFDHYDAVTDPADEANSHLERDAAATTRHVLSWLDASNRASQPTFLFIHYYDPHLPYQPPPTWAQQFADKPYAGEIACVDHHVGIILDRLRKMGRYDDALIIITADHGESLGEHGERDHGRFIYEATQHVPLIIKPPNATRGAVVAQTVALIDLMPTILAIVGIDPPAGIQGRDLSPLLKNPALPSSAPPVFMESLIPTLDGANPLIGIVQQQWKFILTTRPELYDLATDPGEQRNLFDQHPDRAGTMHSALQQILKTHGRTPAPGSAIALDRDAIDRLGALGYIGTPAGSIHDTGDIYTIDPKRPDPKDIIAFAMLVKDTSALIDAGRLNEAQQSVERIKSDYPGSNMALVFAGKIAAARNDWRAAASHYAANLKMLGRQLAEDSAPRLRNELVNGLEDMARALEQLQRNDEAADHWRQLLAINPDHLHAHYRLARLLDGQGNTRQAFEHLTTVLRLRPDHGAAHMHVGLILAEQQKDREAAQHLFRALLMRQDGYPLRNSLALCLARSGRLDEAVHHWQAALPLAPDDAAAEAHHNLALGLSRLRRDADAIEHWRQAVKLDPDFAVAFLGLAMTLADADRINEAIAAADKALAAAKRTNEQALVVHISQVLHKLRATQPSP